MPASFSTHMTLPIFTPRPLQHPMIDHILAHPRAGVFAGMGTGKTSGTLCALHTLQLVESGPVLVIAPLRVAENTWPDEVARWSQFAGAFTVVPIVGEARHRADQLRKALAGENVLATINFENLPWLAQRLEQMKVDWPFSTVVVDEFTKLKSWRGSQQISKKGKEFVRAATGARAKPLAKVVHTKVKRVIGLTGTPAPNGLIDLWAQLWFLDGGQRLGRTHDSFKQRWFRPSFSGYGVEPLDHAHDEIHARIKDVCLSLDAADWFDLHEPVKNVIDVQLPAKARGLYKEMESKFFAEIDGHEVEAFNAAAKSMKLLQLCSGAAYVGEDNSEWAVVHDAKIAALESVVEEAGGMPVLVFYHFKSALARLLKAFPGAINVGTSEGLRTAKAGKGKVWLGHPASMGHGVDGLQYHTNICAFFDLDWNLENHLQAIERIGPTRQAQAGFDRPVFVHYITARDTVDEVVLERIRTKREVQDLLLESLKRRKEC